MATKYIVDNLSGQTINGQQLQPYKVYTALVTQSGTSTESSINTGTLTIGVTYRINENSVGMDFTNVGAPNNDLLTFFVATGTTPASWGEGAKDTLVYDEGAPVVTVLENTIGNIFWKYGYGLIPGFYEVNGTFPLGRTAVIAGPPNSHGPFANVILGVFGQVFENIINIKSTDESFTMLDGLLDNHFIEIRVYN